ncbi:ATP-binding cassette domain-containing protein [Arachidicoccus ginsenosidivorans]|uniref:ATP-binding cassette domain-containing protein n=1 Tax=Arachidicoccus ginsenosidivorans TaxID=496057 RepID=A0A5B8VMP7_9BACT|nr:ATP-binding cassette domain-containing protein [Arachidicoccus ginsenosidivorans]QEC72473.1 ATP-binding cassette domain-containing protein [Arachidicoccus ginsenosidivorans]
MTHTLEVDSIILNFGLRRILSDIYIKCETGKITTFAGRNGTGKSCLLNIILGKLAPLSKSVRIDGRPIKAAYPAINYLPQTHFVPAGLSTRRVFSDYQIDLDEFLHHFPETKNRIKHRFRQLSGGERRLIEVYILIKAPAKFTLLDEPFSQIMPVQVEKIKPIIQAERTKGFLITDHLYKDVIDISDNGYLLQAGKTWRVRDMASLEELQARGYISTI